MLIYKSYHSVYQPPGKTLPVLGTMGLSNEDIRKLREFPDRNKKDHLD